MYCGPRVSLLISELAAVAVGAARGALDVYEEILRTRPAGFAPFQARFQEPEYQRHFGEAQALVDTAEAALLQIGAEYMEYSAACVRNGRKEHIERRLFQVEQQCVRLAWEAVDLMFRTAGTSSAGRSAPLGRYFRNLAVIRTHLTQQFDHTHVNTACLHFGLPPRSAL
jgi:3-hydroxy-9,10-secoandrosta-1,3,5(10)-triene-9,17-dione monooxygenase